jgi:hypothetical protein
VLWGASDSVRVGAGSTKIQLTSFFPEPVAVPNPLEAS